MNSTEFIKQNSTMISVIAIFVLCLYTFYVHQSIPKIKDTDSCPPDRSNIYISLLCLVVVIIMWLIYTQRLQINPLTNPVISMIPMN
jgi:hypothetical protein